MLNYVNYIKLWRLCYDVGGGWCRGQTPRTARKLAEAGAFLSLSIDVFISIDRGSGLKCREKKSFL